MRVRLLGPVDVVADGVVKQVPGVRRKAVLAVLALHPGEVVSTDRIVGAVWGDDPPTSAVNTMQKHLSYLRGVLDRKSSIVARPPGYLLDLGAEPTDAHTAERLVEQAWQATDPAERAGLLRAALALWRGPTLADVVGSDPLDEHARRLDQLRLAAQRALVDTRLALGEHAELLPDLERLAAQHPFDEQVHGQLMLALYRVGRQADALSAYGRLRAVLDGELGIEPGPALRDLHGGILRQEGALGAPVRVGVEVVGQRVDRPVPRQLPADLRAFTGRFGELDALDALLAAAGEYPTVMISAVSGTAGVGKTALAVHWAHRVAERFPDGQLYVNLRGYDPGGTPVDPAEAVRVLLDALGVPADRVPRDLDGRGALYRSLLADQRMLVVLDNARDAAQVRPLLPGAPTCLAVVTSRNQLQGLVAVDGAHPLVLDLLTRREAEQLLRNRLGKDRVDAEPAAVDDIVVRCARLPLALAVVAARAATHPHLPLRGLADELHALEGGDASTDVRGVLSWSYRQLTPDAASLFRLLGLHPGPDIAVAAAASLAGWRTARIRPALTELVYANLVVEHRPGRYTFHDLLRAYATELAQSTESPRQRNDAVHRLLDHYLHSSRTAALRLEPSLETYAIDPCVAGVVPEEPADRTQASAWFAAEHAVLLRTVDLAVHAGFDAHTWQLASAIGNHLDRRGSWLELADAGRLAVSAAERQADPAAQARAHRIVSGAYGRLGRLDDAHTHLRRALDLCSLAGDERLEADVHHSLAFVAERRGLPDEALDHTRQALARYEAVGYRRGQALALNGIGWLSTQLGDLRQAVTHCELALALYEEAADGSGQASTLDSLGYVRHRLGQHAEAVTYYRRALELFRHLGAPYLESTVLDHLGDAQRALGHLDAAGEAWREALPALATLDHPLAGTIRAKLAELDSRLLAR